MRHKSLLTSLLFADTLLHNCKEQTQKYSGESKKLYSRLAIMNVDKRQQSLSLISSWIKRKLAFALIHSITLYQFPMMLNQAKQEARLVTIGLSSIFFFMLTSLYETFKNI